jgi:dTDP-4-amino-4,6-dideoxygalactose transaminase
MAGAAAGLAGTRAADADGPPTPKAAVDWPVWDERDAAGLLDVLNSGQWGRTAGDRRVAEFEAAFARRMQARHCIATSCGTTALFTTLGALGIGPGDEVIVPPYTFVATFNAITQSYALPVFVDSDAETFQIDPRKIAAAITSRTKLLLPVHIGGSPADLDAIEELARSHKVAVIEDACQAVLAELHGRPVGTRGLAGCFSFQASKNLTSGEGGAVVTNDEAFAALCYNFHSPGGGRPAPSSGRGANFRLTEFQAALLLSQFTRLEEQARTRDANAAYLSSLLTKVPGITPARLVDGCTRSAWHLYMFRYDQSQFANLPRARFLKELAKAGVGASGGYGPLNTSAHVRALAANPHYQRLYGKNAMARWLETNQCPVNDRLCEEAVWFTQTKLLGTRAQVGRIAEVIVDIQKRAGKVASSAS